MKIFEFEKTRKFCFLQCKKVPPLLLPGPPPPAKSWINYWLYVQGMLSIRDENVGFVGQYPWTEEKVGRLELNLMKICIFSANFWKVFLDFAIFSENNRGPWISHIWGLGVLSKAGENFKISTASYIFQSFSIFTYPVRSWWSTFPLLGLACSEHTN